MEFIFSSADELNLKDESFDFIYCSNLIHHLPVSDRFILLGKCTFLKNRSGIF
ncbi:class I SAM-dependent methyltransferase [Patescibacteria group bacterium]|nr:class I SAM-dependent methyltransferase [Patescibacteria group bacterium]